MFGLADLTDPTQSQHLGLGNVTTDTLPSGPGGATRPCVQCALYLVTDPSGPLVILLRGPEEHGPTEMATVEVACAGQERGQEVVDQIRRLAIEKNVFRGHVIAFGDVPLRVTDEHMNAALDELLDTRNQLTRILLGAPGRGRGPGGRRSPAALGADAVIPDRGSLSSGWPLRR
jgi:hypothetical protein